MSSLEIEAFKVKRLIQYLDALRGNGTSMITLIIPPNEQISKSAKMLTDELGAASNIKSRTNRLSVLTAIQSAINRLKNHGHKAPANGLVLFCGEALLQDGKEKKINIDFSPFKPISGSGYICDSSFHTDCLKPLLENEDRFGFIVMDGSGCLYGVLQGSNKQVIQSFGVDLPKKHGRGGQSSVRFARLREEAYQHYIRKCSEIATQVFIKNDVPGVKGLILAGSANFKQKLFDSNLFDPRLKAVVLKIVDISYGGENGFNQAIQSTGDILSMVKINQERKVLTQFFTEISKDTGKYVFGIKEVMDAIESRAVEKVILWEDFTGERFVCKSGKVLYKQPTDEEVVSSSSVIDYLAEHYSTFGFELLLVSDKSDQGSQFCKGFGGIGGILRFAMETEYIDSDYGEDEFW